MKPYFDPEEPTDFDRNVLEEYFNIIDDPSHLRNSSIASSSKAWIKSHKKTFKHKFEPKTTLKNGLTEFEKKIKRTEVELNKILDDADELSREQFFHAKRKASIVSVKDEVIRHTSFSD